MMSERTFFAHAGLKNGFRVHNFKSMQKEVASVPYNNTADDATYV